MVECFGHCLLSDERSLAGKILAQEHSWLEALSLLPENNG